MDKFLAAIIKCVKLHLPRMKRIRSFCAMVCAALYCTAIVLNVFVFFKDEASALSGAPVPEVFEIKRLEAGLLLPEAEEQDERVMAEEALEILGEENAFQIHIHVDDQVIETISTGETVLSILSRNGIFVGEADEAVPGLSLSVTEETDIQVYRISNYTEESVESIPFETIRTPSDKLSAGESVIVQKGSAGRKTVLYEVYKRDGEETLRYAVKTTVISEPIPEIVEYGTGGTVTVLGQVYAYKRMLNVTASAYTTENSKWNHTASGTIARVGAIAVDPNVIPMGTKMLVTSQDGRSWVYGLAVAEDTGGSIKGNKIDLYFNTRDECFEFGVRKAKVYILD